MTIQQLFDKTMKIHWSQDRFVRSRYKKEVGSLYENHIKERFAQKSAIGLTAPQIKQWHRSLRDKPVAANRALEVLSRMLSFGEEEGDLPTGSNVAASVVPFTERKRRRYASPDELAMVGAVLVKRERTEPVKVIFCQLLALTGARPISLMRVRREELHCFGGYAILRFGGKSSSTTGDDEEIVLSGMAYDLVKRLPVRADELLIGRVNYRRFWEGVCREAGVRGLWLRDLRRTYGVTGLSSGVALDPIGKLLNHRSRATTERYTDLIPTARLKAATHIGRRVAHLISPSGA